MLREILAAFGFEIDFNDLNGAFDAVSDLAAQMGLAIGVAEAFEAAFDFASEFAENTEALSNFAAQVGITTEEFQELQSAFIGLGLEGDDVADVLTSLQERARDAVGGSTDIQAQFRALGVNVRDANGALLEGDVLFQRVTEGFGNMENATDRAGLALTLFGDLGRRILPVLERGAEGLDANVEAARALGTILDQDTIDAAKAFRAEQATLGQVMDGLRNALARELLPVLSELFASFNEVAVALAEVARESHVVRATFLVLGSILGILAIQSAIAFGPLLLIIGLIGAAVLALIVIVDEIIVTFEGGDSVINDLVATFTGLIQVLFAAGGAFRNLAVALVEFVSSGVDVAARSWNALVSTVLAGVQAMLGALGSIPGVDELFDGVAEVAQVEVNGSRSFAQDAARFAQAGSDVLTSGRNVATGVTTTNNTTFNITGGDPEATAAAVQSRMNRQNREILDQVGRRPPGG